VIPGPTAMSAPAPRSFSLRPLPGGPEQITQAWRSGQLDLRRLLIDMGEESPIERKEAHGR
jgi:hypothetical protein